MRAITFLKAMNDIDDINIEAAEKAEEKKRVIQFPSWLNIKTVTAIAAALVITVTLGIVLTKKDDKTMAVNPMEQVITTGEAEELTGYPLTVPESFMESRKTELFVYNGQMTEVNYVDRKGEIVLTVRKAPGDEDISGNYNEYDKTDRIEAGGTVYTLKGNKGMINLVLFTRDGYSYSVDCAPGMTIEEALELAHEIR